MTRDSPISPPVPRPWTRCQVCDHVWHLNEVAGKPPAAAKPRDCPNCGTTLWARRRWRKATRPTRLPPGTVWLWCTRCGYQWFVRSGILPVRCASQTCGTPYWHRPRREKPAADAA